MLSEEMSSLDLPLTVFAGQKERQAGSWDEETWAAADLGSPFS
jgi:hypothetical protein